MGEVTSFAKNLAEFDNHKEVIRLENEGLGVVGFIAIHTLKNSYPSLGATRVWNYKTETEALSDALRLSRLMSNKSLYADLPYGGAKAALMVSKDNPPDREELFSWYAGEINKLDGRFITGSDVGIQEQDVVLMSGLSKFVIGGNVPAGYYTALGVLNGIETALEIIYGSPEISGKTFAVQGLGKTGLELVKLLYGKGGKITVTDADSKKIAQVLEMFPGVSAVNVYGIYSQKVDIFCPCALHNSIDSLSAPLLRCAAIVGSANNQMESPEVELLVRNRGILYAIDYIVNNGGFISVVDQYQNGTHDDARIKQKLLIVKNKLKKILTGEEPKPSPAATTDGSGVSVSGDTALFPKKTLPGDIAELIGSFKTQKEAVWIERGERQALKLFGEMSRRVPAYRDFLKKNGVNAETVNSIDDFKHLPLTNKENYLLSYPLESLCWDGKFKGQKWTISSTSGSTGEPFYFPRTGFQDEQFGLTAGACLVDFFEIDKKTTLFLDCFALGVWIGGVFMYQAIKYLIDQGRYPLSVITPGADKAEAIKAIKNLAPKFDQIIIGGYAPLVKDLIDVGGAQGLRWNDYSVKYFFAAEGFTEGYRDYIVKNGGAKNIFTDTINHYGTADLGTMAHETPVSILIRRLAAADQNLAQALFSQTHKQPTLTQYIPELYYFEQADNRVVCSSSGGMPLIRYDLKDRGGVKKLEQIKQILKERNIDIEREIKKSGLEKFLWQLPFVYLFERDDLTASIYSVNIYPQSIRKVLEKREFEKFLTGKFSMLVDYDQGQNQFLQINLELKSNVDSGEGLEKNLLGSVVDQLLLENSEWRDFYADQGIRHKIIPQLLFWPYQDPKYFKPGAKQKWVKK